ncbi:hypothetical protein J8J40_24920, partial [Mycobacterium tuberculosis]|nr:hypothetical protein [Mycobacterium tuberculosis]
IDPAIKAEKRTWLRAEIADVLAGGTATVSAADARSAAVLVLALMRAMIQLSSETRSDEVADEVAGAVAAMREMVRHHLERVTAPGRAPS